jgi:hypothetical protein
MKKHLGLYPALGKGKNKMPPKQNKLENNMLLIR